MLEKSYHFYSDRIHLHFCDDPGGGRSDHTHLQGGGAFQVHLHCQFHLHLHLHLNLHLHLHLQVSLAKLQLDYYPYHLAR